MKRIFATSLGSLFFLCSIPQAQAAASIGHCARQLCLIATGVPCIGEQLVLQTKSAVLILAGKPKPAGLKEDPRLTEATNQDFFATTSRGPIGYLDQLGLYTYDFRNKEILDIASGQSRFTQMVNLTHASTGTRAISVDLFNDGPLYGSHSPHIRGDAFALPFRDKAFDLTLNSWMLNYYVPNRFRSGQRGELQMLRISDLVLEQLRVTADGGEARIGFGMNTRFHTSAGIQYIQHLLAHHPRVESFEINRSFPIGGGHIKVKLKTHTPENPKIEVPNRFPTDPNALEPTKVSRRGIMFAPLLSLAAMALMSLELLEGDEYESLLIQLNTEFGELSQLMQNRLGYVPLLGLQEIETVEQAENTLALLKNIRRLYADTPLESLKKVDRIGITHEDAPEIQVDPGIVILSTRNPQAIDKLRIEKTER